MATVTISGRTFEWSFVSGTSEFKPLERFGDPAGIDVLRISLPGTGFDAAIRVFTGQYSDGIRRYLGPLLVVGSEFPDERGAVPVGTMVALRPKLVSLAPDEPNAATVERIIQWCCSPRFGAVRVNSSGGKWLGYGREAAV
jgi:hypothetical protein